MFEKIFFVLSPSYHGGGMGRSEAGRLRADDELLGVIR
jgi:hypothetical protein